MWECPLLCLGSPLVTVATAGTDTSQHKVFFILVGPKLVRKNADTMQNVLQRRGQRTA